MKDVKEIVCKRWLLPNNIMGIALYPFIFYNGNPSDELIRHEWEHINQIRIHGWFKFYLKYIRYHFKYGYEKNPFEVNARKHSHRKI